MNFSIQLNNERWLHAEEIDDESTHWCLPSEFVAMEISIAQNIPQNTFSMRSSLSQIFGVFNCDWQWMNKVHAFDHTRSHPSASQSEERGRG
ncbi:MAG: hypothetical protein KBD00_02100 [Candidatus Peribacteraceae bacterium]|nr:hypothetical protein [Candidatus Peribacteraceae bacterium]